MNTTGQLSLLAQGLAVLQRQKRLKTVEFPPSEIATPPKPIWIPPGGRWLRVPPMVCALVTHPTRRVMTYAVGEHHLKWYFGYYTIQYFDLQQQTAAFPEIKAVSSDAWDVVFTMEVLWRVVVPAEVIAIPNPRRTLESVCRSTVINFIRTNPHDKLVSTPGEAPLATARIEEQICSALNANNTLQGLEITAVLIMDTKGDRRRTEVVQKSIVEKTEIEQTLMIQREQARLAKEKLEQEQQLAQQRQTLAIKEAETNRLKTEEQGQVRLRMAEIAASEAKTAREAQIQEVEIQQLAERQRMQHEQILKAMEVRAQAFGQLASALFNMTTITGGIQRGFDGSSQEVLLRAMESLAKMPAVSFGPNPMLPSGERDHLLSLNDRLVEELQEVHRLPGVESAETEEIKPGLEQAEVAYLNLRIFILFDENYPLSPPVKIAAKRNGDPHLKTIDLDWAQGMNLQQLVLQVAANMYSPTTIDQRSNNNGHKKPESLAI